MSEDQAFPWCGSAEHNARLVAAVESDDAQLISELLTDARLAGVDLQQHLDTALVNAASKGFATRLQILLEAGAEPDQQDHFSNTPLILAAEQGHLEVVQKLLSVYVDVNKTDNSGKTALHWACANGNGEVVQVLLDSGALPDAKDFTCGITPIMMAARHGHKGILRKLLQRSINIDDTDFDGETALFDSARNNRIKCVELLISAGASVNHRDKHGRSSLMSAVLWNRPEVVKQLIWANCKMEVKSPASFYSNITLCAPLRTPLEAAVIEGSVDIAKLLVAGGSNVCTLYQFSHKPNDCKSKVMKFIDEEIFATWLDHVTSQPRTLKELVRIEVRRRMGSGNVRTLFSQLPIPTSLQAYMYIPDLAAAVYR